MEKMLLCLQVNTVVGASVLRHAEYKTMNQLPVIDKSHFFAVTALLPKSQSHSVTFQSGIWGSKF